MESTEELVSNVFAGPFSLCNDPRFGHGYVVDWLVCGPFYEDIAREYDNISKFETDYLISEGGEDGICPYKGLFIKSIQGSARWERVHSYTLPCILPQEQKDERRKPVPGTGGWRPTATYAACYIKSSSDGDVYFWIGGNMWHSALYVNHNLMTGFRKDHGIRIHLKKGFNLVLVKTYTLRAKYVVRLSLRITGPKKEKVRGLSIWLAEKRLNDSTVLNTAGQPKIISNKDDSHINVHVQPPILIV